MAAVLDADYETVEQAAEAVLAEAFDIYERKAKFGVAAQLKWSGNQTYDPESLGASKLILGFFPTAKQAEDAARSLVFSSKTGEEFRAWVLPVWTGTPYQFYTERKKAMDKLDEGPTNSEKLIDLYNWKLENPDKDESDYPGMPEVDPRSDCPICGSSNEEGE